MAAVYKSLSKSGGAKDEEKGSASKHNRQRVLMLSSRGVTFRHRHLMNDIHSLLPHSRKESKLDTKTKLYQLNELAELYNCNNVLFFEARKGQDLYMWMSKPPNGPTVKFHLQNPHTMDELHFTGNCLKGSRPILSFDASFDEQPHLRVIKELLLQCFGVPQGARKSKPFIDHVMAFTIANGKVWIRCYQINESEADHKNKENEAGQDMEVDEAPKRKSKSTEPTVSLVEIGPRFVLTPIIIQESSFGGPILYENKEFVSPNQIRADLRLARAARTTQRREQGVDRSIKRNELTLTTDSKRRKVRDLLDEKILFA